MILPIRTNIRPWRVPYANYSLIALNALVFLLQVYIEKNGTAKSHQIFDKMMLVAVSPHIWQFVTYAFLHAGLGHILGNMFFLYLFGNNVNDRLGHLNYILFYLAGAILSGVGHTVVSDTPVLGASGAVSAVVGAYLVLYPQTLITVVYWLFFIGTFDVPAIYFILFKMIFIDNIMARTGSYVAYDAHLSGYAAGIAISLIMLMTGLISSDYFDLWSMFKRWDRRRRYRSVVEDYDPFTGETTRKIKIKDVTSDTDSPKRQRITQLRTDIEAQINQHNLPTAAAAYLNLMDLSEQEILPARSLLDIANQLASEGKYPQAAKAYEQFLEHYPRYDHIEQVQLMAGLIYSRYLNRPDDALKHLKAAEAKLIDSGQLKMCRDEIASLKNWLI